MKNDIAYLSKLYDSFSILNKTLQKKKLRVKVKLQKQVLAISNRFRKQPVFIVLQFRQF